MICLNNLHFQDLSSFLLCNEDYISCSECLPFELLTNSGGDSIGYSGNVPMIWEAKDLLPRPYYGHFYDAFGGLYSSTSGVWQKLR